MVKGPKIALMGCGLWGRNILRDLIALGCEVAVIDPSAESRDQALRMGATTAVSDAAEVENAAGIIVASPASAHVGCIEAILDRGVPIFCEKPLCQSVVENERLAAAARGRLFEMHIWRYHPGVEKLAALLRAGELGEPLWLKSTRVNWTSPRKDVDPVWTLAPHDLSIVLEVLGAMPRPKAAIAERLHGKAVGLAGVMEGPVPFLLDVSTRHREKRREVRLHGSRGIAVLNDDRLIVNLGGDDVDVPFEKDVPPLQRQLKAFLDHVHAGTALRSSMTDSRAVLVALTQLRELAGLAA